MLVCYRSDVIWHFLENYCLFMCLYCFLCFVCVHWIAEKNLVAEKRVKLYVSIFQPMRITKIVVCIIFQSLYKNLWSVLTKLHKYFQWFCNKLNVLNRFELWEYWTFCLSKCLSKIRYFIIPKNISYVTRMLNAILLNRFYFEVINNNKTFKKSA